MTKQTRKFITVLRQQFKAADETSKQQIWDILTALRGPDESHTYMEKESTTAVIRSAVFGNSLAMDVPATVLGDSVEALNFRKEFEFKSSHFRMHVNDAFSALGLKWNKVNIAKTKKKVKK